MAAHDAFISYAWAEGTAVASALQRAIRTIGKPWYRPGTLDVHRDTTDTEPSGSLRSDLFAELDASRYLILLASPKAARSRWVEREVGHWLSGSGTARLHPDDAPTPIDRLILVLLDGEIHWGRGDFDWSRTDCLPRALSGRYAALPRFVDLRWAVGRAALSVHDPDFRSEAATIAAPIVGTPRRELLTRDVRESGRARKSALGALATLSVLLVLALAAATVAVVDGRSQKSALRAADARLRTAAVQAMQRDATALRTTDPARALQLGVAAHHLDPGPATAATLTGVLTATPFAGVARTGQPAAAAALGTDWTLTAGTDGTLTAWTLEPVGQRSRTRSPGPLLARSGPVVAVGGPAVALWDYSDPASPRRAGTVPFTGLTAIGLAPDGRTLATGGSAGQVRFWNVSTPSAPTPRGDVIGGGAEPVTALALGPDLLAYARSGTVRIWSRSDAGPAAQLATVGDLDDVGELAFSPDGKTLAAVTGSGVRLLDVSSPSDPGRPVVVRSPAGARYGVLAWSADGRRLAGGGADGTVTVWDPATGAPVASHSVQRGAVRDVAFDGETLFSAGSDGTVMRWETVPPDASPVGEACRRAGGGLPEDVWASYAPGVGYHDTCAS